jgi:hypothetical protein
LLLHDGENISTALLSSEQTHLNLKL